jgi:hypothetical protein
MIDQKYRVFTNDIHEYDIEVDDIDNATSYKLIRTGLSWSENSRGTTALEMSNDGNYFHINYNIDRKLDYSQIAELSILLTFINWYEHVDQTNNAVISIETSNDVLKFII